MRKPDLVSAKLDSDKTIPPNFESRECLVAWTIEGYDGLEAFWKGSLPKSFTATEVVEVLRLLASKHLTENEILSSARGTTGLLDAWHNHEKGTISVGSNPSYLATAG